MVTWLTPVISAILRVLGPSAVNSFQAGYDPRRPRPDEPQYDLAWEQGDVTWVAEVKSITPQNEERQLRHALGQVLRYRQLLEADGRTARAMIAVEHEP